MNLQATWHRECQWQFSSSNLLCLGPIYNLNMQLNDSVYLGLLYCWWKLQFSHSEQDVHKKKKRGNRIDIVHGWPFHDHVYNYKHNAMPMQWFLIQNVMIIINLQRCYEDNAMKHIVHRESFFSRFCKQAYIVNITITIRDTGVYSIK